MSSSPGTTMPHMHVASRSIIFWKWGGGLNPTSWQAEKNHNPPIFKFIIRKRVLVGTCSIVSKLIFNVNLVYFSIMLYVLYSPKSGERVATPSFFYLYMYIKEKCFLWGGGGVSDSYTTFPYFTCLSRNEWSRGKSDIHISRKSMKFL